MKKKILFSLLLLSWWGTSWAFVPYEVPAIDVIGMGTGIEGTYLVQVSVEVNKGSVSKEILKKWGIYAVLFHGIPAGERCPAQPPLIRDKQPLEQRPDFWLSFFDLKKGEFLNFVIVVGEQMRVVKLSSKKYKLTARLSVSKDKLWSYLKAEGFVKDVFEVGAATIMKPSIMVVPSNVWCKENGFLRIEDGASFPDYKAALNSSMDLQNVISKINILMSERGFPLENLETAIKGLEYSEVENRMIRDKETGTGIQETSLDRLYRQSKSDIVLQLTWGVNKMAAKRSVTFNVQALDSYTNKQIAGVQGTGAASFSAEIPVLLEEAVLAHMDILTSRLTDYFDNMRSEGREIALDICLFDTDVDFETEYGDEELSEVIARWMAEATVNHRFSRAPSTATMLQFRNVRIPLTDKDGQAMDAYAFARGLARFLKKTPYQLEVKVLPRGLGKAMVIIGEN